VELEKLISRDGLLGVPFGATRSQVVEVFGRPEDWTDTGAMILRYGDLQLTFEDSAGLWLATIWNVAGRLRLRSQDLDVDWRVTSERLLALLSVAGLEGSSSDERQGSISSAVGPHFRAEAVFDGLGLLEKLSLVRCAESDG
jgi:hypothetical protein